MYEMCNVITKLLISNAMAEGPTSIVVIRKNLHGLGIIM